jgi:hypothetical protein
MTKTQTADENVPYTTGPGAGLDKAKGTCTNCGRSELVKTTTPEGDELGAVYDTAGQPVKQGASVTVCALCGAVQAAKPKHKPKAKAKAKRKAKATRRPPRKHAGKARGR